MPNSLSFFIPGPGDDDGLLRSRTLPEDCWASLIAGRVSVCGDGACRADALPAEEDDAVLAEDDGREKK